MVVPLVAEICSQLPVLAADGAVAGFLSIGDLVKETISEQTRPAP